MLKLKKNHKKKIIIWGFAKVGKSALKFLSSHFSNKKYNYLIIDQIPLPDPQKNLLTDNVHFLLQKNITGQELKNCLIIPSPGIDISRHYAQYKKNIVVELDLFHAYFHKPVIAITGSVGKTTITTICSAILKNISINCFIGGNIGTPMLEGIQKQNTIDCALLEISSFQLEYSRYFAPDIAVLTNIYPNHFDRHKTFQNYIKAKLQLLAYQNKNQYAILPLSLRKLIMQILPLKQKCIFFSSRPPTENEKTIITDKDTIIFMYTDSIFMYHKNTTHYLTTLPTNPTSFFSQNWVLICAILYAMRINPKHIHQTNLTVPEHRLEYLTSYNGISFYNDSKSTTPSSTQAALAQFTHKKIHLFLGGLSKGINREQLITSCKNRSIQIYCFGHEANQLSVICTKYGIQASCHDTLELSFTHCMQKTKSHDIVLFSPSGSSFDLYTNYMERGLHFKALVKSYITKKSEKKDANTKL